MKLLINVSRFWNLGWSDISMVTVHETEMIFPWGKIPMRICPARLWQVISKYISLCDGALHRNYQGSTSEACLRLVLEWALESLYLWISKERKKERKIPSIIIIYIAFAYIALSPAEFCWLKEGPIYILRASPDWTSDFRPAEETA